MGDFHDAVSSLLEAFARGISIIKTQRGRRKAEKIELDPTSKSAEVHLSKTLKHNQVVVQDAYGKDLVRHGPEFAKGDAEAHSALSSILLRLNAGFVSVIERFTRGLSTPKDYETLLSLSNASRQEAIETFSQLSIRLSRSSLALVPINSTSRPAHTHKRKVKNKNAPTSTVKAIEYPTAKHTRSKSAPELSVAVTPLGLATPEGWVRARPKAGRKHSSDSSKSSSTRSGSTSPKRTTTTKTATAKSKPRSPPPLPIHSKPILRTHSPSRLPSHRNLEPHEVIHPSPPPEYTPTLPPTRRPLDPLTGNRKSIMSFASDSTKLGEIPEHKWARQGTLLEEAGDFPVTAYYPLQPYVEPQKPRSRLRKLFRR